ncbi:hypothetical protein LPJ64_004586 [Coemansia asiatica]|uniref:U3 small nucleolar RNA-associated protein 11 n=1 Tax=Coemansia asiatica TaxID=1052880 RepID=A0A9W7XIM5_9FUNG|nr:hypothetical protein LPJ64_004586 [Coemansia asiatica]KAJ2875383.1 hypothetical protein FB639_004006 [Coemansia asiatica]
MSSLKKFAPRREHKERGQLASRKKFGHLEKHKDYVLRARDYSEKQRQLKRLRERAAARNPDEFYFNMERSQMKNGQHIEERNEKLSPEMLRLMETQDITYVRMQRDINKRNIERLQSEMHLLNSSAGSGDLQPRHTVFVDNEEEVKAFDPAKYFDTLPEFVDRKFNRPKVETLESSVIARPLGEDLRRAASARQAKLRELKDRLQRETQLKRVETEMAVRRVLKEKGQKKKVGTDLLGLAIYKWKAERKK